MDVKEEKRKVEILCSEQEKASKKRSKSTVVSDEKGDEVEQFLALLDRIQATQKMFNEKCMDWSCTEEICKEEHSYKNMSPWKLSFQWEEFYKAGIKNGSQLGEKNLVSYSSNNRDRSVEVHRQGIHGSGNHVRVWSSDEYAVIDLWRPLHKPKIYCCSHFVRLKKKIVLIQTWNCIQSQENLFSCKNTNYTEFITYPLPSVT